MELRIQDIRAIKANNMTVPDDGEYITSEMVGPILFHIDRSDNTIELQIDSEWFTANDIKELRKLLKILEAEIK